MTMRRKQLERTSSERFSRRYGGQFKRSPRRAYVVGWATLHQACSNNDCECKNGTGVKLLRLELAIWVLGEEYLKDCNLLLVESSYPAPGTREEQDEDRSRFSESIICGL